MQTDHPPDLAHDNLLEPLPLDPFDASDFMFTTATIAGARAVLEGLGTIGDVWEYRGRYYPVRRGSTDLEWLRRRGAELVPIHDDALHQRFDRLLTGLQRADGS